MNNFQQPNNTNSMQIPESIQNTGNSVTDSGFAESMGDSLKGFSDSAQASVDSTADASDDFLQSNTLFAKFAFVILIVIVFIVLLSLGIVLIQYFTSPSKTLT